MKKIKVSNIYWDEKEKAPYFILEDGGKFKPEHPNMANWGFPLGWREEKDVGKD